MKAACCTDPASPSLSLIKQICYPNNYKFSTEATKWECDHEGVAREAYISEMKRSHSNFSCSLAGFRPRPIMPA